MDVTAKGIPSRLDDVPNGECFAFEASNQIAIGIKIAYPTLLESRILVLTRGVGQPPALQDRREARPTVVYKQPTLGVVTGTAPNRLRNGVANPKPGQIIQFEGDVYIGFVDEHDDPSAVSLKTGLINSNPINGPAAIFETWQITLAGDGEPEIVFDYTAMGSRSA
jgi:hypothetical protein